MSAGKRRFGTLGSLLVRLAIAAVAIAWTASKVDLSALFQGLASISAVALAIVVALVAVGLGVGALRFRLLLEAYGAEVVPGIGFLYRAYLVGLFYNTFLPANVGGDLLRGHATRRAFGGAPYGVLVVFIERLYGLSGLLSLAAIVLLLWPGAAGLSTSHAAQFGAVAGVLAIASAVTPALARRVGPRIPGKPGRTLSSIPKVAAPGHLGAVWFLSLVTHALVAISVYALLVGLSPDVTLTHALALAPVALASLYLPTIAGLGVREAAFVFFFGQVGVSPAHATAASLALFAAQALVALVGGISHLYRPLDFDRS